MKKFTKAFLATMLVAGVAFGAVGCSTASDKSTTTTDTTATKEDAAQLQRAAFAAALIAESKMIDQFADQKGLEAGKDVAYSVPKKDEKDALGLLENYWSSDLAKKEYESYLGDKALLGKANAAFKAANDKANAGKKPEEQAKFVPATAIADKSKLSTNDISSAGAKFEEVKVTQADSTFTVEYKGLKYTLERKNNAFKVTGKEGKLQK
ncbi:MAG: hypothetical protein ACXVP5_06720 [Tumebacillaceae bacterium]